jgi:cephalosporin hydroxylase
MKKLPYILIFSAMLLSFFSLGPVLTGEGEGVSGFLFITPGQALIFALFLFLLSLLATTFDKSFAEGTSPKTRGLFRYTLLLSMTLVTVILVFYSRETGEENVIKRFRKIYYNTDPHITRYLGMLSLQYPTDNWVMQEIISDIKPDFIIETGTFTGATTLFYADILEKAHPGGRVISIDHQNLVKKASRHRNWKRVEFYQADSTAAGLVKMIAKRVKGKKVLVTLDSNHAKSHVLRELELYSPMVSPGSYIIVQDTHLGGHPNHHISVPGEGPWEAVEEFLKKTDDFIIDRSREKHLITQNPSGYLKRSGQITSPLK